MDCLVLDFSEPEIEALADRLANALFAEIYTCALRQYPWNKPVACSMEALGDKVVEVALTKFYQRCG
jgi:hypothetical protein